MTAGGGDTGVGASWTIVADGDMQEGRAQFACAVLNQDQLFVAGGTWCNDEPDLCAKAPGTGERPPYYGSRASVESYSAATGRFTLLTSSMNVDRAWFGLTAVNSGFGWLAFAIGGNDTWPCSIEGFAYAQNPDNNTIYGCWCPKKGALLPGGNLPLYYPMSHARAALGVAATNIGGVETIFAVGGSGDGQNTLSSAEKWILPPNLEVVGCKNGGTCPPPNAASTCVGGPTTPPQPEEA